MAQLRPGERGNSNSAYIEKLADAWSCIQDHDVFRDIQSAAPLAITYDVADSGSQHPFELIYYTRALASASQTYTAGINLFWIICNGVPLQACRSGQPRSIRWPEARSGSHVRPMTSTLLWPM